MDRTSQNLSRPSFIVDYYSLNHDNGHQIDWATVVDDGTYGPSGEREIPAGTIMFEQADGTIVPRAQADIVNNPGHTAAGVLVSNANEDSKTDALTGYGLIKGGILFDNLLPDYGNADFGTFQTELEDDPSTTGYGWRTFADNRG